MSISAKIIAHSKSSVSGKEIVSFELIYPRFIHSELMTHRLFSRNAASSRAIPVRKMIDMVRNSPAKPVWWGKNQPGMQAKEELTGNELYEAREVLAEAAIAAADHAEYLEGIGAHKQIVNRILEPFQWMKTVVTATDWGNWYWLRNHADAQPEIEVLAKEMFAAAAESEPVELTPEDWHVPYFGQGYWLKDCGIPLGDALAISASCCAQVSYRTLDDSLEKAQMIYERLVGSVPVHASPFEHQAKPISSPQHMFRLNIPKGNAGAVTWTPQEKFNLSREPETWQEGITHTDREGRLWSGNFQGWIQHRQLIPNNVFVEGNNNE